MAKLLLLLLAVAVLVWLITGRRRRRRADDGARPPRAEEMVRCVRCGVHLPRSEALLLEGGAYCCPAHRDSGAGKA